MLYTPEEISAHAVAGYYGLASLSHGAVIHALVRDQVARRVLGVNECEALSLIYHDHVHPGIYGESCCRSSKRQHCRNACASNCMYKATGASQPEFQPGAAFVELAPTRVSAAPMQRNIYSTCVQLPNLVPGTFQTRHGGRCRAVAMHLSLVLRQRQQLIRWAT